MDIKKNIEATNYQEYVKKSMPKSHLFKECVMAFIVGGLICVLGEALNDFGKKVICEIDDDLFSIEPENQCFDFWHPNNGPIKVFIKALQMADGLMVSTPKLAEIYGQWQKNVLVVPNAIDLRKYTPENNIRDRLNTDETIKHIGKDKITVGWTGSFTHLSSMKEIANSLKYVFQRNKQAAFVFCGKREYFDMIEIPSDQKIYVDTVPFEEHFKIYSLFDINLTPVKINRFNQSKSELKCLEAAAWSVPSISTKIDPYINFYNNSDGANVLIKNNRWRDWDKSIDKLINDESYRKELGKKSYQSIVNYYNLDNMCEVRYKWFEEHFCD
jgi:glycosyltransferase involved in cell wall biosynthesis